MPHSSRGLILALVRFAMLVFVPSLAAETLPNGIELPTPWPPVGRLPVGEPPEVPYLQQPPAVIPVDLGRQLFVDDFLIATTDLRRVYHQPRYHSASPVLSPQRPWELGERGEDDSAGPYSDGVWYDPRQKKFMMWYEAAKRRTCLALSDDGIAWTRPELDVEAGSNIVLKTVRDSATVWLDHDAVDPNERFKLFEARYKRGGFQMALHTSGDGIHWSGELAASGPSWDRSTAFFNPFRQVWVASVRGHDHMSPAPIHRLRCYFEGKTAAGALGWKQHTDEVARGNVLPNDLQPWVGADRLDPHHPDPKISDQPPQLYNLDAFAYESLMIGLFTIWQGPQNDVCRKLNIHKRNEVLVAFSRDGYHWDRASRRPFLPVSEDPKAWNAGNVQSAGGGCLIVGDELYFYCSGRTKHPTSAMSTGLATLRRDGFASMDAGPTGGQLTTRPLRFSGKYLFVNAATGGGTLRAEVLDAAGQPLAGLSREDCLPFTGDATRRRIEWTGGRDLSAAVGQPVQIRFHLSAGSIWSFWITDDKNGASGGYAAAGGPGFSTSRDVGR